MCGGVCVRALNVKSGCYKALCAFLYRRKEGCDIGAKFFHIFKCLKTAVSHRRPPLINSSALLSLVKLNLQQQSKEERLVCL